MLKICCYANLRIEHSYNAGRSKEVEGHLEACKYACNTARFESSSDAITKSTTRSVAVDVNETKNNKSWKGAPCLGQQEIVRLGPPGRVYKGYIQGHKGLDSRAEGVDSKAKKGLGFRVGSNQNK